MPKQPLDPDMFDPACPSSAVPIRIGDKWTALVVVCLADGPRRFSELRVPMRRVTPKVLTETLRAMERDGMLTRTQYPEIPPRVEYELTELGRSLLDLVAACRTWGDKHLADVLAARAAHSGEGAHPGQDGGQERVRCLDGRQVADAG
ncbi:helix-turn-helix domain-containing protein [Actinokineospora auranticolor]|uniref:winged helix-turn-helix transcriptional regulator n=1 Tax=Actinokineospora auranticolor TaxID=155976 RepID=UPI0031830B8A